VLALSNSLSRLCVFFLRAVLIILTIHGHTNVTVHLCRLQAEYRIQHKEYANMYWWLYIYVYSIYISIYLYTNTYTVHINIDIHMWTLLVHLDRVQVLRGAWGIVLSWLFRYLGALGWSVGRWWAFSEKKRSKGREITGNYWCISITTMMLQQYWQVYWKDKDIKLTGYRKLLLLF